MLALIGLDLVGGLWANAALTTRRWYHRPGQKLPQQVGFAALHVDPFVVAWLFRANDWGFAFANYGLLLGSVVFTEMLPPRLQHAVVTILFTGILLLNWAVWPATPGVEWFIPVYFLKTLLGHASALETAAA